MRSSSSFPHFVLQANLALPSTFIAENTSEYGPHVQPSSQLFTDGEANDDRLESLRFVHTFVVFMRYALLPLIYLSTLIASNLMMMRYQTLQMRIEFFSCRSANIDSVIKTDGSSSSVMLLCRRCCKTMHRSMGMPQLVCSSVTKRSLMIR